MTSIYNAMAAHPDFPEHLVGAVAKRVHQTHFQPVLRAVESYRSPFERLLYDAPSLPHWVTAVKEAYPALEIRGDFFHGFRTVVLKLNPREFVAFHHHNDLQSGADVLVEGSYDQGTYTIHKCFFQNPYSSKLGLHTLQISAHGWTGLFLRTIDMVMNHDGTPLTIHPFVKPPQRWRMHRRLMYYLDSHDFRRHITQISI